jgi:hypothetical protein
MSKAHFMIRRSILEKREKQILRRYPYLYRYALYRFIARRADYYIDLYKVLPDADLGITKIRLTSSSRDSSNSSESSKIAIGIMTTIGGFMIGSVSQLGSNLSQAVLKMVAPVTTSQPISVQKSTVQINDNIMHTLASLDVAHSALVTTVVGSVLVVVVVYLVSIAVNNMMQNHTQVTLDSIDFILNKRQEHQNRKK